MLYIRLFALCLACLAAAPAVGQERPLIAPAPEWVEPLTIPAPDPARANAPAQMLLLSSQTRFDGDVSESHTELATLIQQPQGLAFGNISLPWPPDRAELIVHKVQLLRGGKTIDLLAGGQEFTVVRRESNLEGARLDGILTAVLQPEGLSVGDTLVLAFTMRQKPGIVGPSGENAMALPFGTKIRRVYYRHIWPKDMAMQWRATPGMGTPKVRNGKQGKELIVDIADAEAPKPPEGAPQRYALTAFLQISRHQSWSEISPVLAPGFTQARAIPPGSPLAAEVETIRAATADRRAQALAALRLVQDKVRYFDLAMGEAGYIPASAAVTWARKYGDCKDKTVTLLALLDGLGIEAEPVLVSAAMSDGLDQRLPALGVFDHVIVKARIDGADYWLDGTRTGDRDIAALASAPFRWGLPILAAGAGLESIPLQPPILPLSETRVTYDASKGLFAPVPVKGSITLRGDIANAYALLHAQAGDERFRQFVEGFPGLPEVKDLKFTFRKDEQTGAFVTEFQGTGLMPWEPQRGEPGIAFLFGNEVIGWYPDFEREDGKDPDIPFALSFPDFSELTETVILPDGGKGFRLEGKDLDQTLAGTQISRTIALENGRAVATSRFRHLAPEIGAAEARAAVQPLKAIQADKALIRAPERYAMSADQKDALLAWAPKTAADHIMRGYQLIQAGQFTKAIADFDRALELEPNSTRAAGNKAIALLNRDKKDEAKAVLAKLAAMPDAEQDSIYHQAVGWEAFLDDRPLDAVRAFTKAIRLEPEDIFSIFRRSDAYLRLGRIDDALLDIEEGMALEGPTASSLMMKGRVLAHQGSADEAVAAFKQAAEMDRSPYMLASYGAALKLMGRNDEAAAVYKEALEALDQEIAAAPEYNRVGMRQARASMLADSGQTEQAIREISQELKARPDSPLLLNSRCWIRATANVELELALKDCDTALRNDPENATIADSRALVKLRMGRLDEAIEDLDAALGWQPKLPASLYVRGLAKRRRGDRAGGDKDIAAARSYVFDIASRYKMYGLEP